jgi:hypothetical protein
MSGIVQYDELLALTGFDLNQQPPDPFHSLGKNPGEEDSLKWAMDAKQSVWDATRSRANKQITWISVTLRLSSFSNTAR